MPLVLAHFVLTKSLGVGMSREIRTRIARGIDLCEKGLHAGLVEDVEGEWAVREGRDASGGEEEDEDVERIYHGTVLSGKIRQALH